MNVTPYLLHHLLERSAAVFAAKEAIVDGARSIDYRDGLAGSRAYAASLLEQGLKRRDHVAIFLPKSTQEVYSIFGTSMAGGVFVPMNGMLRPSQVEHIIKDCGVRFLITTSERASLLRPALADAKRLERVMLIDDWVEDSDGRIVPNACMGTVGGVPPSRA